MPADDWRVLNSTVPYENEYFDVTRMSVRRPDDTTGDYYRVGIGDGVLALGVHEGDALLVRQYRPRLEETTVELPGGGIQDGETPEEAALREFEEETGHRPEVAEHLGSAYISAWTKAQFHLYWVDDITPVTHDPPEAELEVERIPEERLLDTVLDQPRCSWNVTAVVEAARRGLLDATIGD